MRTLMGLTVIGWGIVWLVHLVSLLDCSCSGITEFHFAGVTVSFIGGFAVMLPDKEK